MKNLFKKPWFIGSLIIGIVLIVFFLNLWIFSLNLLGFYADENFWSLAGDMANGTILNIYAFIFTLAFYVSIIPILLSGYSLLRKNNWGLTSAIVYFLTLETILIVFQSINHLLSLFALILIILNVILVVGALVLLIFRIKVIGDSNALEPSEHEKRLSETKIPLIVLFIDIISLVVVLTTFFIPIYSVVINDNTYNAIPINVILQADMQLETMIYFLANFAFYLSLILFFANCISHYFFDKERFISKSKTLINASFVLTLLFFLMGVGMNMYHMINGDTAHTLAFIPLLLMCIVIFGFAVLKGKFNAFNHITSKTIEMKYPRIEPLIYIILLTTVTALLLIIQVIKISVVSVPYTSDVNMTGIDILRDYASLDPGYRIVAYILVVTFISSGLIFVFSIASYLSKYRQFNAIVKLAVGVNLFFVFIIAIASYYFQIGQQIDQTVIQDIFSYYGITIPSALTYEYKISSDAIYALIASAGLLVIMFMRKAFDRDELQLAEATLLPSETQNQTGEPVPSAGDTVDDDNHFQFDPCPALTDLDSRVDEFKADLNEREAYKAEDVSLPNLVNFVVEYARNSRLHLSYTPEDIATFVAGLGASKLSILQGMSGTGKTSLPKIFSEAVFGNCEIVEVESSWKDKNELLGYYNEFSMKYTPKKFTVALYKAALNQNIFTFILLDEMNLSRIEYYFSDFLSLMENEEGYRELKLINIKLSRTEEGVDYDYLALDRGNTLKIPSNVWFIGTANRDESTCVISDKVYDRAQTMNFTKRAPKVRNYSNPIPKQYYDYEAINHLFEVAKSEGDFDAENNEIIKKIEVLLAPFNISFGNRILKQIEDFVNIYKACFANEEVESEAVEKILLSKVVAKLEVKTIDDKEKLESEFEKLNLKQCVDFIKRLDNE